MKCTLCPRACGVDRAVTRGFCGAGEGLRAARAALHFGEEPCISGVRGSGTVFFSGCHLRCVFCQNSEISAGNHGWETTPEKLSARLLALQDAGAHNINFVTATHYYPAIRQTLALAGDRLRIPCISNTGGYEREETVAEYADLFPIWMPDLKFCSSFLSARYLSAPDYFEKASRAILCMRQLSGPPVYNNEGILTSGVLLRHLVMPGARADSLAIVDWLGANFGPEDIVISLMSQYLPLGRASEYPEINRRVTTYEYRTVENALAEKGFRTVYTQSRQSATAEYVPAWNGEGIRP
ncbi:MAG: radical SAM protein [Clostridia bacterium]|nr:radical SAM protein [Clostridia bacterium]